ncbi:hypothetical protein STEG23_032048 [Scotinomys teguina]
MEQLAAAYLLFAFSSAVTRCSSRSSKTFKPKKNIPEGSHQYELLKHAEATLGSGNLRQAVMLPEGEDLNEWIAVNTVDFFNQINMLYGTITEFCTEASCPVMSAGPRYTEEGVPDLNVDGCEPYVVAGDLNSGPLREQSVLLTSKPSVQPSAVTYR